MTALGHAIVFVSDMDRSVRFYRDVLGFSLRFDSPDWTEFDTGGTTLALHVAGHEPAGETPHASSPPGRCQIGMQVDDLDAFHEHLTQHGVPCLRPPTVEEFGVKLANYADPDGLPFSVSERRE
ncbi:MAG: VOC family protein [Planctomycetaceae bacterium]